MKEKLESICRKYDELQAQMSNPAVYSDSKKYQEVSKEVGKLDSLVKTWRAFQASQNGYEEAKIMLNEESDSELKDLAKEEMIFHKAEAERLEREVQLLLLPQDPNDDKDVILEIRAGAGGDEAAIFSGDLYRMYNRFCEKMGWRLELLSASESETGGYKEVIASCHGTKVYSTLKYEAGVHRVQRVPVTESQGRVHTSTCTVAILPEAEDVEIDIPETDLRIDTYRASGAGGQHVNRTESAIRITHIPTNTVVTCQDERSQIKNRAKAMKILKSRLLDQAQSQAHAERTDERRSMVGTGDRSERIRTYNYPQNRLTDHRIGLTLYQLDSIMEGDLNGVIEPLRAFVQAELLEAQKRDELSL
jgi:peptide chain release factor 1